MYPTSKIVTIHEPISLTSPDGWVSVYRGVELACGHWRDYTQAVKVGHSPVQSLPTEVGTSK